MRFIPSLLLSFLAGISTIIGVVPILLKIDKDNLNKFISFCLSFSIGIMISISIFDLIPTSFIEIINHFSFIKSIILLLISFLISYMIITYLSKRIDNTKTTDLFKLGILNMIVLIFHNLPEGIATFLSTYHDFSIGLKLSLAIMLHNIPEGISIAVPIYYATKSRKKAITATLISGLSEPIGAILAYLIFKNIVTDLLISIILVLVAGLMIVLSIEEMLPTALKYNEKKSIIKGFILGIVIVVLSLILA